jgi:hypothetical protein
MAVLAALLLALAVAQACGAVLVGLGALLVRSLR